MYELFLEKPKRFLYLELENANCTVFKEKLRIVPFSMSICM